MSDRLAFLDCETLGLNAALHPVWELAIITDGNEYHWFVAVDDIDKRYADPEALAINGFEERYDRAVAIPDYKLVPELAELLAGKVIVGANPHFDLHRIEPWFEMVGRTPPWHYRPVCIESVLYGVNRGWATGIDLTGEAIPVPWRALDLYGKVTGLAQPEEARHTALGDARFVRSLWEWAHR